MAITYVNRGDSFIYNQKMGSRSIVEYTDGTRDDISLGGGSIQDDEDQSDDSDQDGQDDGDGESEPAPEPINPPDQGSDPDPEPDPEPESPQTITIESKCTSTKQKSNGDHPTRHLTTSSSGICLTNWHSDFEKCLKYSHKTGVPLFYVWSNGSNCGHCFQLKSALSDSNFVDFMKQNKLVWCFTASSDSGHEIDSSFAYLFGWGCGGDSKFLSKKMKNKINTYRAKEKSLLGQFPFCGLYWYNPNMKKPKIIYDIITVGDQIDGGFGGNQGSKKAVSWFKDKIKKIKEYGYNTKTATFTLN